MEIKFTLDWIGATLKPQTAWSLDKSEMFGERLEHAAPIPRFGYNRAMEFESGTVCMWNREREEMGIHVLCSGSALRWMTAQGNNSLEVFKWLMQSGARCSRVDLAIDVFDSNLSPTDLCKPNRLPYNGKGRTPKFTQVGDQEDGWTIYIGSRSSSKFLRIYDKAKESKDDSRKWTRIEIECKGEVAHWLGSALPPLSALQVYELASTLCRSMVDFSSQEWGDALSSSTCDISIPKKTAPDTLKWLVDVCAPALVKEQRARPSEDVLGAFFEAVEKELSETVNS